MKYREIDLNMLISVSRMAGEEIMKVYASDFKVETKSDYSPVTEADKIANKIIVEALRAAYPDIPFISEETNTAPYNERKNWKRFWLIDPLDGTKEFINRNGEFTVNIALIEDGIPSVGVVHVPVSGKTYIGVKGLGSFISDSGHSDLVAIGRDSEDASDSTIKVVGSRSHLNAETLEFVARLKATGKIVEFISSGSSLKFCLVAEGKADIYPRYGPTMEWDTAAAHAVALYAGKRVLNIETRQPLFYNKENLLNPYFIVE